MEDWEEIEGVFGSPDYVPVAFEDLEKDKFYYVRMTTHDLSFSDMILYTDRTSTWKDDKEVHTYQIASRKFKRVFEPAVLAEHAGKVLTMDEVDDLVTEIFHQLPYATDETGSLMPAPWHAHPYPLKYTISREHIKMEISDAEYGYVFFKKAEAAVTNNAAVVHEGGRRRRRTRRRRTYR